MSMTIGVCDDCGEQLELVKKYICRNAKITEVKTYCAMDPELFLEWFGECQPEIVFLDIDMDGMDGIKLGTYIREINEDTIIVYITGHEHYAVEAFGVRAFHYLLKPLSEKKFKAVFNEAISAVEGQRLQKAKRGKFIIKRKKGVESIEFGKIRFFEKVGHKIKIHTDTGTLEFYGKIFELLKDLDQTFFVQCHQGYIINTDKIVSYKDRILFMTGDEQVPVSRSFSRDIKEMIERLLFDEGII